MINMTDEYTSNGQPMRVLWINGKRPNRPVIAMYVSSGDVLYFTAEGAYPLNPNYDLVKVSEYSDYKIDEPVLVRDDSKEKWQRGHFAGVAESGKPMIFAGGHTKWGSRNESYTWNYCCRPTTAELQLEDGE